jgi:uncharacterized protein (TIGR03086 family)
VQDGIRWTRCNGGMNDAAAVVPPAMKSIVAVVRGVRPDQLNAPTPCQEWDVRTLLGHLAQWAPHLERAGRREAPKPVDREAPDLPADWAGHITGALEGLADAWSDARAWDGETTFAGGTLPAPVVGGMVLGEFVLHGWDLAAATGQRLEIDDSVAEAVYGFTAPMAEQGRHMGVYGDEVQLEATAPPLARALAVSGRDPGWCPPAW